MRRGSLEPCRLVTVSSERFGPPPSLRATHASDATWACAERRPPNGVAFRTVERYKTYDAPSGISASRRRAGRAGPARRARHRAPPPTRRLSPRETAGQSAGAVALPACPPRRAARAPGVPDFRPHPARLPVRHYCVCGRSYAPMVRTATDGGVTGRAVGVGLRRRRRRRRAPPDRRARRSTAARARAASIGCEWI
jgi:hypothetical protein